MRAALQAAALIALPGAFFILLFQCLNWATGGEPPRLLRPLAAGAARLTARIPWRRREEPLPDVLLALELRRMAAEVRRVEEGCQPHRAERLRAAMTAYDLVLLELAANNDVPTPPTRPPLTHRDRFEVETGLMSCGVDW